jgi:hypothetical protein
MKNDKILVQSLEFGFGATLSTGGESVFINGEKHRLQVGAVNAKELADRVHLDIFED